MAVEGSRLSPTRLVLVLAVTCGLFAAAIWWALHIVAESRAGADSTWFAPYVDVTLTPTLHFEDVSEQPSNDVVLGFVVADPANACSPSWGAYYNLEAAARALDLDRRVVRLRERGGDAIVSFGGAINDELAVACTDIDALTEAYRAVIDRYDVTVLDFDIEGAAIADREANARRAEAIRRLQEANDGLQVWFTLPVAPFGMTEESVTLLDDTLAGGVELNGVNVMTMNFGGSREGMTMREATSSALTASFQQLDGIYQRAGVVLDERAIWAKIGATPMIGQNDVAADVFTVADAEALLAFSRNVELARLSFWSANRDVACGAVVDDDRVSNTCSGVNQDPLEFSTVFAEGARTSRPGERAETSNDGGETREDGLTRDDPRTSPYPIWRSAKAYEADDKVVWQGRVYQAKWWTQGDQPDAPVKNTWETPWRYLGPVLESDREAVRNSTPAPDGVRPRWAAETVYVAGDEVEHDGHAFRAKWWTQGDLPEADPDQPYDHPWEYLGDVDGDGGAGE